MAVILTCIFAACGNKSESSLPSEGLEYTLSEIGNYSYAVTDIGSCTDKNVVIPSTYNSRLVNSIGDSAFKDCIEMTSVTIPDSITSIGTDAFKGCTALKHIYYTGDIAEWCEISGIPNLMSYGAYGRELYINGKKVEGELVIPKGVTSLKYGAFYNCSSLTSVIIPDSVTIIGESVFGWCRNLTSITIPNGVMSISKNAFFGCYELASISIPDSVTSIGSSAFYGTAWYDNQPDGLVYAGKVAYDYKGTMPSNTSIVLKEGTLGINDSAFSGCKGLTSVTIPNSVTSIGDWAFYDCTGLTSVTIGNSVTSIGYSAFYGCKGLTSVTIPNSVTSIGKYAFYGCTGLTSVTIGNSVTSIGYSAFYGCKGLTSVTIPNSVTSIGNWAFDGCKGLTSVTIPNSVTSIGNWAFDGCSSLTSIMYKGTTKQWFAILKETYWKDDVPSSCKVYCTDGTISIYY